MGLSTIERRLSIYLRSLIDNAEGGTTESAIARALAATAITDAQARATIGSAANVAAGLRSIGIAVVADTAIPAPTPTPTPYLDPDLNLALAFKQKIKSYDQGQGDRAAQLFGAFPALKSYLNVGHKTGSLASGASAAGWSSGSSRVSVTTLSPSVSGYDIEGMVYVGASVAANVTISNCRIRAKSDGAETIYKIQKDNSDADYKVVVEDCTLEAGQANNGNYVELVRVMARQSSADNFKGGSGAPGKTQRIVQSWGEAAGYNNPLAHGDGVQFSTVGDTRVVATVLYSAPTYSSAAGTLKYTGIYSTSSAALTNAVRIDASGGLKRVERVHVLGVLSAFGSYYPLTITAQQTNSIVRNVTVAHCTFAPSAFRYDGNAGDAVQLHGSFTSLAGGGGLIENVGFVGNEVFGFGPLAYNDRGGPTTDVTGIWHWNPASIDAATVSLWKELGLLTAAGAPAAGMLRSVAGAIATQARTVATTGAPSLALDLSSIPEHPTTLHLAAGSNMHALEYVA